MIRQLEGTVIDITATHIVLAVHGVGYHIALAHSSSYQLNDTIAIWTHLAVRETALDLYGFTGRDQLAFFELLLTLPKIGPKSAMQIMHQAELATIYTAIREQDAAYLAKQSGIGKKTAEKIVVELKDKIATLDTTVTSNSSPAPTNAKSDVIDALIALGYTEKAAREAAKSVSSETSTAAGITEALRQLN